MSAVAGDVSADPAAMIRSRQYRMLLVLAALTGLLVSIVAWGFLEAVHQAQVWIYTDLPKDAGYHSTPSWWGLPWLALAGVLTAFAVVLLPGKGGHVPVDGLKAGSPTQPNELPGVLLAAFATLAFGLVLGPEAPLIATGTGLGVLAMRGLKRDAPDQAVRVMAAAGAFAAVSSIFGSPVIGAVVVVEAAGLGGPALPVVLLPGLLAAGIGSLVFVGAGSWTGLSTNAWALSPFPLPPVHGPGWGDFGWTLLLAPVAAAGVFAVVVLARWSKRLVDTHPWLLRVAAGLAVGGVAIAFAESTGKSTEAVLFSGQDGFASLFGEGATLALSTLVLLVVFKGLAWGISLGSFRGGPTFPAIFFGAVGGLMAARLPGYVESQAVAALVGATCVSMLRLPLSSVVIATLLCGKAGLGIAPMVVLAVVSAHLVTAGLSAYVEQRVTPAGPRT